MEYLDSLTITVLAEDSVMYESPYWGQHGLSLYVTAVKDKIVRNILVDVAQNNQALMHNMKLMGIKPSSIDTIVLTHCHYDHTQGVVQLLKSIGKTDLPVVAHPSIFRMNFVEHPYLRQVGVMPADSRKEIEDCGGLMFLSSDPLQLMPGVSTTGYVERQTDFEEAGNALKTIDTDGRIVRDAMDDDISVMAALPGKGLVILTGCSHAGIVNILRHAKAVSGIDSVETIIGGLHLLEASAHQIKKTAEALDQMKVGSVYAGHCTGFNAQTELRKVIGERFQPLRTGENFEY